MPPRKKKPSKASVKKAGSGRRVSTKSEFTTAQPTPKSYRTRQKRTTISGDGGLSQDEFDTQPKIKHANRSKTSDDEMVLDEIVVAPWPPPENKPKKPSRSNQSDAMSGPAESVKLRRSSRTSSISYDGKSAQSSSSRVAAAKKQEFSAFNGAEDDDGPDELSYIPSPKKKKITLTPTKPSIVPKKRSKWENPELMLTDPLSPLAGTDLRGLLCSSEAWDILTPEEKSQVLAKFPDNLEVLDPGRPEARPDIAALLNNDNFRNDIAQYQGGLKRGFHDPEWIQQAKTAHELRLEGYYDESIAENFERKWGIPLPQWPQAGASEATDDNGQHANGTVEEKENGETHSIEASEKAIVRHGDEAGALSVHSADLPPVNPIKVNGHNMNGNDQAIHDIAVAPDDKNTCLATDKKKDQSLETDAQVETTQTESATTQGPIETKLDTQHDGDTANDAELPNVPPLPDAMEDIEYKKKGDETEPPKTDEVIEDSKALEDISVQVVTEPAPATGDIANGVKLPNVLPLPDVMEGVEHKKDDEAEPSKMDQALEDAKVLEDTSIQVLAEPAQGTGDTANHQSQQYPNRKEPRHNGLQNGELQHDDPAKCSDEKTS
ncbi:Asx homology domain-containing protein [Nemania sp. FL0916]|nr:Asx homology domain-containing protein [Nemania sp. FL0916]